MELLKIDSINSSEHWINPTKVARVTFTPAGTFSTPGIPTAEDPNPAPIITPVPASLVVHLDNGFSIQVADAVEDIIDKINKEI